MIQVAIIGAGFIGPAHLEALRRLGDDGETAAHPRKDDGP